MLTKGSELFTPNNFIETLNLSILAKGKQINKSLQRSMFLYF